MKTLYLIRHGETDWNRLKKVQGSIDTPLNAFGQAQAKKLVKWFEDRHIDAIYASDMRRAYDTASTLAAYFDLEITTFSDLRERNYGILEGLLQSQFTLTHSEEKNDWLEIEQYKIEPLVEVKKRVYERIEQLKREHQGESVAVVSHGGAIRAFLSYITDGDVDIAKLKINNTAVTEITYTEKDYHIVTLNDTSHLNGGGRNLVV